MSTLVLFDPFCPLQSYSGHSVHFVHFGSIWFIFFTSVQFCPIWSILSTLVLIYPFILIQSTLVLICSFILIKSTLVLLSSLRSYLVHFVPFRPIRLIWTTTVHFDPLQSIFVHLHNGRRYVWVESIYSKSNLLKIYKFQIQIVISKILYIAFIPATLLLSYINVVFHSTSI